MNQNASRIGHAIRPIVFGTLLTLVASCDDKPGSQATPSNADLRPTSVNEPGKRHRSTRSRSVDTNNMPRTFHGYACTQDCSGHEAGYQWAEDHDIDDPDDCGGNSESFIEGCKAYAEEHGNDAGENEREE
jgi:hypothetical protein